MRSVLHKLRFGRMILNDVINNSEDELLVANTPKETKKWQIKLDSFKKQRIDIQKKINILEKKYNEKRQFSKEYTIVSNDPEGLLKKIDKFICGMHQSNQTAEECKIAITVEKYKEK